ncbi:patatin-like phospholipase family protein [Pusillimonas noertemannii]|uniref:patatin-like phospholipase family protein n=1 Tax=Pusillimonas noertemannii TaxID=305977 RepID=UPI00333FDFCB
MANTRSISLALQGGGSHGAFTWGVLDRLLEDERIVIDAISGTSAGALNAAVLVNGYVRDGAAGARAALDDFWLTVSGYAGFSPIRRTWADHLMGNWNFDSSPSYQWANLFSQFVSPYQSNPLNIHPLRDVLQQQLDIDAVRSCKDMRLFIAATNVRSGRARIFDKNDISIDALLASACLPHLYQAIEIDGDAYWDGGYMGNPSIWPLIYKAEAADVVLVQITPLERDEVPRNASDISNRLDEIAFNSSLMHEMRAIAFVKRLLDEGALKEPYASRYKNMRMHMIGDPDSLKVLGATSKLNAERDFIDHLKEIGRERAESWLAEHFKDLGKKSTLNIRETFL